MKILYAPLFAHTSWYIIFAFAPVVKETGKLKHCRSFSVNVKAYTCSAWKYNTWNFYQAALTPFANLQIMSWWPPGQLQNPEELLRRLKLILSFKTLFFNWWLKLFFNPLNSSSLVFSNVKIHTLLNFSLITNILVIFSAFIKNHMDDGWYIKSGMHPISVIYLSKYWY